MASRRASLLQRGKDVDGACCGDVVLLCLQVGAGAVWPVADVPLIDLAELSREDTPTLSLSTDSLWDQVGTACVGGQQC